MAKQNNLKRLRKQQGFSIMELAAMTGVSTSTIVGVERYNLYPGPSVRERLAKAFGVSEIDLFPTEEGGQNGSEQR